MSNYIFRSVKRVSFARSRESNHVLSLRLLSHQSSSGQYLQQSIVPTDHFQKSLPRLPIPKLQDSCNRYLNSLRPLVSLQKHAKASEMVEYFKENEGASLNKELVERDKKMKHTSYISGPWFDMYLRDRSPVVLNYNPFLAFNNDTRSDYMNQVIRATNFIVSAMRFKRSLKENLLEPDVYHLSPEVSDNETFRKFVRVLPKSVSWYGAYWYKAFPLDMSQYGNLFNSSRIPRLTKDELFVDETAKHMLIIRNGNFYCFDVLDENGNLVKSEIILANMSYICSLSSKTHPPPYPVGYLTSENRDVWAKTREKLIKLGNGEQLHLIDSALFVMALDDEDVGCLTDLGRMFLYGNGANRWFDKSFTLIVNKSGEGAINFEHSWGDGVAVLRFFNDVYQDTINKPHVHPDTLPANVDSSKMIKKLDWHLDEDVEQAVEDAKRNYEGSTSKLDISYIKNTDLNKQVLKTANLSPDSFMQLAFQMAYHKIREATVPTYESCSTAAFKHGRTETIRSATNETKATCQMFEENKSPALLYEAMKKCSVVHSQLTKEAALGQGFDRHLMGLRKIAEEQGKLPELYHDRPYKLINHVILSTSSLASPAIMFGGFAPVTPDGFGIGYMAADEYIGSVVTSYNPINSSSEFKDALTLTIDQMYKVLQQIG